MKGIHGQRSEFAKAQDITKKGGTSIPAAFLASHSQTSKTIGEEDEPKI
jgi:hypothetical protein